jgi:iron(III) transport system permease protein
MGELAAALLVMPAGCETLSIKIYTLMHYGVGRITSALSVILILVTLLPVSLEKTE